MCYSGRGLEALRAGPPSRSADSQSDLQCESAPCSSSGPEHLGLGLRVQGPRSAPEFAGLHLDLLTTRPMTRASWLGAWEGREHDRT
ncbi:unnamed protein product [Boreogadus saida]